MFGTWSNWLSRRVTHESIRVFNLSSAPPQSGTDMTTPIHCLYRACGGFCGFFFFNSPHGKTSTEQLLWPHLWIITCHPFYCGTKNRKKNWAICATRTWKKWKSISGECFILHAIFIYLCSSLISEHCEKGAYDLLAIEPLSGGGHRCFSFTFLATASLNLHFAKRTFVQIIFAHRMLMPLLHVVVISFLTATLWCDELFCCCEPLS